MSRSVAKWMERARYDLETARAMQSSGRYLYVVFCCQQSVEKAIKAVIAERTGEFPPRIHSLPRLTEICGLQVNMDRLKLMTYLSNYSLQSRYPEEIEALGESMTPSLSEKTLLETEETITWLFSMLQ